LKEDFGNVPIPQPFAVLGEYGHVPDRVIQVHAHEPTEQQVVVELFHQHSLAAHRVQGLQQERSQQLLGRDRRSPRLGIQLVEPWLQVPQCLIGHDTKRAQGVILRNSLLGADVAEHVQLLLVFSAHAFFLSGRAAETTVFPGTVSASNRVFPQPASLGSWLLEARDADINKIAASLQTTVTTAGTNHYRLRSELIDDIVLVCAYNAS
jgi:hypothetical protein